MLFWLFFIIISWLLLLIEPSLDLLKRLLDMLLQSQQLLLLLLQSLWAQGIWFKVVIDYLCRQFCVYIFAGRKQILLLLIVSMNCFLNERIDLAVNVTWFTSH